jgi:hypothetical protein
LKLAAESPFEGERGNALAAAERMASGAGMTLEEAAGADERGEERRAEPHPPPPRSEALRRFAHAFHLMDHYLHVDKQRRAEALAAARARGLDAESHATDAAKQRDRLVSRRKMDPFKHAAVLLEETSLPFHEVAAITGLDIYKVVGLKLKMRPAGSA